MKLWRKTNFFLKKISSKLDFIQKSFPGCFFFAQQNYGQGQENISEDSGLRRCFSNVEKHQLWKFEEKKNLEFLDLILFFSHNCPCWCKEDFFFSAKACKEDFFFFQQKRVQPQQIICWSSSLRRCLSNIKKYQLWNFEEKQIFFKKKFHPNWISSKKVFQDVFVLLSKTMNKIKKTFLKTLVFDVAFLTLKSTNCENLKKKKI